ncbi:MAG: c-type cytochrome biogenesis protein CcmI [Betaproteobacteria bacterium]|nr:c-type cytochrome biogenesis protein CcmI [Betaproteobacteria bacterium]
MILFWSIGGALAAAALILVLRPLLARRSANPVSRRAANIAIHRDQLRELEADLAAGKIAPQEHEKARGELEARLLEDVDAATEHAAPPPGGKGAAALVGIAVPLAALAIYFAVGAPDALTLRAGQPPVGAHEFEGMVAKLAARLRENPDDEEGWKMLGRSYAVLGNFPRAVDAYTEAARRAPRDAQLLADFADTLAMARGRSLQGEPEKLVQRALEIDANNLKALALAGTAAFERKDFKGAAAYWQRMLPLVPADSEDARNIRANVAEANQLAGSGAAVARAEAAPAAAPAAAGLRGTVSISPKMKGKFSPEDTVFIYARAASGPPMPLAVLRRRARELPVEFALDDSMAMAPGMNLSAHPRVVITARVTKSGGATPQPGDLQGASKPVASDASGVAVVIDSVVH